MLDWMTYWSCRIKNEGWLFDYRWRVSVSTKGDYIITGAGSLYLWRMIIWFLVKGPCISEGWLYDFWWRSLYLWRIWRMTIWWPVKGPCIYKLWLYDYLWRVLVSMKDEYMNTSERSLYLLRMTIWLPVKGPCIYEGWLYDYCWRVPVSMKDD